VIPFIGLTGGIGAGKSVALAALARLGASGLSTDEVVHQLYDAPKVRDAVIARFGPDLAETGSIDRAKLAQRAFATPEDRAWLEGLLWPLVDERMAAWREQVEREAPASRAAVVEVPLLFEAGVEHMFDATIAVIADEAVRERRAASRGYRALDERSARQLTQQEKAARATYVVVNDGTLDDLQDKLSTVLEMLHA
jgi:dephospho-CoA kinase